MGADERQFLAGARRFRNIAGGEGKTSHLYVIGQPREDEVGAGDGDYCSGYRVLRKITQALSTRRRPFVVRRQQASDRFNGLPQQLAPRRLFYSRSARHGLGLRSNVGLRPSETRRNLLCWDELARKLRL